MRIPVYNDQWVDFDRYTYPYESEDISHEPGRELSLFAEVGMRFYRFKASIFYETLNFSKSDVVDHGNYRTWQPESEAKMVGINFGVVF